MKIKLRKLYEVHEALVGPRGICHKEMPFALSFHLGRLLEKVRSEIDRSEKTKLDIVKPHVKINESGQVITGQNGQLAFNSPEAQQEADKAWGTILDQDIEFDAPPFDWNQVRHSLDEHERRLIPPVNAFTILALEPFVTFTI